MITTNQTSTLYVGLAGEGTNIGEGGLYRKSRNNTEWEMITEGLPKYPQVRALLVDPIDPSILYAGTQMGPYRSNDAGKHWSPLTESKSTNDVWSLAFHPNDSKTIYVGYEPAEIWMTENSGQSWMETDMTNVIYPHITTYMPPTVKRIISIAINPSCPTEMYAAIEVGGLLGSTDGGQHWKSLIDGPYSTNGTLDLHSVIVHPFAETNIFIATQIGLFRSRDKGIHWEKPPLENMFSAGSYCRHLSISTSNPKSILLAASAGGGSAPKDTLEQGALFRSFDIGETWERIDFGETPQNRMFVTAVDQTNSSNIHCATNNGKVYSTFDDGLTWTKTEIPEELSRGRYVYSMACG